MIKLEARRGAQQGFTGFLLFFPHQSYDLGKPRTSQPPRDRASIQRSCRTITSELSTAPYSETCLYRHVCKGCAMLANSNYRRQTYPENPVCTNRFAQRRASAQRRHQRGRNLKKPVCTDTFTNGTAELITPVCTDKFAEGAPRSHNTFTYGRRN